MEWICTGNIRMICTLLFEHFPNFPFLQCKSNFSIHIFSIKILGEATCLILFKDFKRAFQSRNLLLTLTFVADENSFDEQSSYRVIFDYIDQIQIRHTNMINSFIELGISPKKIVLHILLQGNERLSNTNISFNVEYVKGYNEICSTISKDAWEKSYDGKNCIVKKKYKSKIMSWIMKFDCSRSIANKVRQAMKWNLIGIMITYLSTDDFLGKCQIELDTFDDFKPVEGVILHIPRRNLTDFFGLRTVTEAIGISLDEIQQENKLQKMTSV